MMQISFGSPCSNMGKCASNFCVSMSPAVDASILPSMASDNIPVKRFTDTVAVAPSR